jgi:hypothetical protein
VIWTKYKPTPNSVAMDRMGKLPHAISTGNQYSHTEWTNSNLGNHYLYPLYKYRNEQFCGAASF